MFWLTVGLTVLSRTVAGGKEKHEDAQREDKSGTVAHSRARIEQTKWVVGKE